MLDFLFKLLDFTSRAVQNVENHFVKSIQIQLQLWLIFKPKYYYNVFFNFGLLKNDVVTSTIGRWKVNHNGFSTFDLTFDLRKKNFRPPENCDFQSPEIRPHDHFPAN